jgi:hypothetical protein
VEEAGLNTTTTVRPTEVAMAAVTTGATTLQSNRLLDHRPAGCLKSGHYSAVPSYILGD